MSDMSSNDLGDIPLDILTTASRGDMIGDTLWTIVGAYDANGDTMGDMLDDMVGVPTGDTSGNVKSIDVTHT